MYLIWIEWNHGQNQNQDWSNRNQPIWARLWFKSTRLRFNLAGLGPNKDQIFNSADSHLTWVMQYVCGHESVRRNGVFYIFLFDKSFLGQPQDFDKSRVSYDSLAKMGLAYSQVRWL